MRIALCQMDVVPGDIEANLRRSEDWIARAAQEGAELVLLPELVTTGYALGQHFFTLAEPVPGQVSERWARAAASADVHIVGGTARLAPSGLLYNSALVISPTEGLVGIYDKAVPPLYLHGMDAGPDDPVVVEEAEIFRRGDHLPVFSLPFGRIGVQICQDAVYGEFTRVQALNGADLIVQVSNSPAMPTRLENDITPLATRIHAFDTGTSIAFCNRCGSEGFHLLGYEGAIRFDVASHVCDPWGNVLAMAESGREQLLVADLNLEDSRRARWEQKFHRDWRPDLLGPLVDLP